jgi:methylated-DNA-[protein]-cysteine S-methyltransferase
MTSPYSGIFTSRSSDSPIGRIEVSASNAGLIGVGLFGHHPAAGTLAGPSLENDHSRQTLVQILEYLNGKRKTFDSTIDWSGVTAFHRNVLIEAMKIGFGEVWTYGQLAAVLGKPAASRAIGGAMARNPIPIIIPCHRVVAADGRLTGYSAADGIATKRFLLELEGRKVVGEKLA